MHDTTARAIAAIGPDYPAQDWQLRPRDQAAALPVEAGALKRVLERPEIAEIMDRYAAGDAEAIKAQRSYKSAGHWGLRFATIATLTGALFLLPLGEWFGPIFRTAGLFIQSLSIVAAALASAYLFWRQPFDRWMKARGRAEIARVQLFDTVVHADEPEQPGELPLLPLKLEYFRRYQLSVQRNYYAGQGRYHERAAGATRRWLLLGIGVAVAAFAVVAAGFLEFIVSTGMPLSETFARFIEALQVIRPPWSDRALLAAGIVSSALYSFASSRSLMNLDERNASRYLTNSANLEYLAETGLEPARAAAADGRRDEVYAFIGQIQGLVSSEHKEWVLLREIAPKPDARLSKIPPPRYS